MSNSLNIENPPANDISANINKILEKIDCFNEMIKGQELDSLVKETSIGFDLEEEPGKLMTEILDSTLEELKEGLEPSFVFNLIKGKWPGENFFNMFESLMTKLYSPYQEVRFLREHNEDALKNIFREVMENYIIVMHGSDYIVRQLKNDFTNEDIEVVANVFEIAMILVIEQRLSFNLFKDQMQDIFGFRDKVNEIVWELINRNKAELVQRYIINKLSQIE